MLDVKIASVSIQKMYDRNMNTQYNQSFIEFKLSLSNKQK